MLYSINALSHTDAFECHVVRWTPDSSEMFIIVNHPSICSLTIKEQFSDARCFLAVIRCEL